ncbi:Tektin-2 [Echinococcus granulosus]|uniref:Tektin n=1 Tax=Echinococcus granulosus TaxID=6210 RepID=W6UGA8_ECHGR|nr:Tektin-2 [Echinococcus granulosus]EUB60006.1 Tektin-2 [Echinococcus granulosus]
MATDNKQPHEYPYPSWYHSLHAYSRASDDLRRQAELMRQRGKAIRIESDALAKYYQLDVNNRLRNRIQCNREWVHMLRDLLNAIISVTQTLGDIKIQADQFLANLNDAMTVNLESLTHRDTRRDGDYVLDDVQEYLGRKEIRDELQGIIDDAVVHLKALVAIRREAEEAIANKKETIEIDVGVHNANEKSANIGFKPFRTRNVSNYLELQTYEDLFRDLLSRGEDCVAKGRALCEQLYDALNRASNRLGQKAEDVSQRLRRRIFETSSALRELRYQQVELERMKEKLLMDIAEWQSSRASKVAQQKLSETRTEERTKRPGLENAKDAVYYGLNEEHSHLIEAIDALDEQIVKARHVFVLPYQRINGNFVDGLR